MGDNSLDHEVRCAYDGRLPDLRRIADDEAIGLHDGRVQCGGPQRPGSPPVTTYSRIPLAKLPWTTAMPEPSIPLTDVTSLRERLAAVRGFL
jgi:hypothetical protein